MDGRAAAMGSTCGQGTGVRVMGHRNPSGHIPLGLGISIHHPLTLSINPLPAWTPPRHFSGRSILVFWDLRGCGMGWELTLCGAPQTRWDGLGIPTWPRNQSQPGRGINPNQAWQPIPTWPGNQSQLGLGINPNPAWESTPSTLRSPCKSRGFHSPCQGESQLGIFYLSVFQGLKEPHYFLPEGRSRCGKMLRWDPSPTESPT